eukprot:8371140-Ditylum_brightwellii.AAC.1
MTTYTLEESKGIFAGGPYNIFDFDAKSAEVVGPIGGFAGCFTADFKSRTDEAGIGAPKLPNPTFLSTGPNDGYTQWGQQIFHLLSSIPLFKQKQHVLKKASNDFTIAVFVTNVLEGKIKRKRMELF